jgi:hypothetical protein
VSNIIRFPVERRDKNYDPQESKQRMKRIRQMLQRINILMEDVKKKAQLDVQGYEQKEEK